MVRKVLKEKRFKAAVSIWYQVINKENIILYTYEPCHTKRVLRVILIKMFIFLICIFLRLIFEILSGIAVEIRFLWDSKHGIYEAASFIAIVTSWYLRMDMRKFISVILYMNIICIASWLFEANLAILHCSDAFAQRHKHCKPECSFMQTGVDYFLPRKYDVISQLRHSLAKDPLCVTRLNYISLYYKGFQNQDQI